MVCFSSAARGQHLLRLLAFLCLSLSGGVEAEARISYAQQIQPIFDSKCVACHACYESPCQLNLGSAEGLARGASNTLVFDGTRTLGIAPTRLFTDANTIKDWRDKGFYSVLPEASSRGVKQPIQAAQAAMLARMLALGRQAVLVPNAKLASTIVVNDSRQNSCPANEQAFNDYSKKHALEGMPLGVTGLSDDEYGVIQQWLAQGAPIDSKARIARLAELSEIHQWELFLNRTGKPQKLVSRWLYEHLFLAHLYFSDQPNSQFFELVRSRTPIGKPIKLIVTDAPNDDPNGRVYYRLRPLQGAFVVKTHITFALNASKLARTKAQFFAQPWSLTQLPGYDEAARANPFVTFDAIPAQARYQFMLDNAEYFVRSFIRGPVCHGQIATDVIRDQFWTFFQAPKRDLFIEDAQYRKAVTPLLGLAGQKDGLLELAPEWLKYRDERNQYDRLRTSAYAKYAPEGASSHDIWDGEGRNHNALLSIFRHFDSAGVRKGLMGELPQTAWLMDYPLFERTYYVLVANFNVFGSVSHQAQTRLYFDWIRQGSEMNFLRLLPADERQRQVADWYQGSGKLKVWFDYSAPDYSQPSAEVYVTAHPKEELFRRLLKRFASINERPDPINRCAPGQYCARVGVPEFIQLADQAMSRLASRPARIIPVINDLPELTLLRVHDASGGREVYSLMRNRAHSNVAFMLGEDLRYQPEHDTLTIYPGIHGSYPNFAFDVDSAELEDFTRDMRGSIDNKTFEALVERWGVRRSSPKFWPIFHDFTAYMQETEPTEAGILDMSRWENL